MKEAGRSLRPCMIGGAFPLCRAHLKQQNVVWLILGSQAHMVPLWKYARTPNEQMMRTQADVEIDARQDAPQ